MRTTIDLPDPLFRAVKAHAAAQGIKLKDFISEALRQSINSPSGWKTDTSTLLEKHRQKMNEHFQRMDEGRTSHEPVGKLNRESLHDRHA